MIQFILLFATTWMDQFEFKKMVCGMCMGCDWDNNINYRSAFGTKRERKGLRRQTCLSNCMNSSLRYKSTLMISYYYAFTEWLYLLGIILYTVFKVAFKTFANHKMGMCQRMFNKLVHLGKRKKAQWRIQTPEANGGWPGCLVYVDWIFRNNVTFF